MKYLSLLLALIGSLCMIHAQQLEEDYITELNTVEDDAGVKAGILRVVFQDSYGYLWIGTQHQLFKYDGYESQMFLNDPGDTISFSVDYPTSIVEDHSGDLWIGGRGGLNRYCREKGIFYKGYLPSHDSTILENENIEAMIVGSSGHIWIGTNGKGLFKLTPGGHSDQPEILNFSDIFQSFSRVSDLYITSLAEGPGNYLWIGSSAGLFLLNLDEDHNPTGIIRFINDPEDPGSLSSNFIQELRLERDTVLWIAVANGLNKLSLQNYELEDMIKVERAVSFRKYFIPPDKASGKEDIPVQTMYQANNRIIWIGTSNYKLYLFHPDIGEFYEFDPENSMTAISKLQWLSSPVLLAWDIVEDNSGIVWIANFDGKLIKISPRLKKFRTYLHDPEDENSLGPLAIGGIEDDDGILWIATETGLDRMDRSNKVISHFKPSESGHKNRPLLDYIGRITQDPEDPDILWLGSLEGYISKFNKTDNSFRHFMIDTDNPGILKNEGGIWGIKPDSGSILWISSLGGGLIKFNKQTETWVTYRHSEEDPGSLSSNGVLPVFFDSYGEMWVGTEKGLNKRIKESDHLAFKRYYHDPEDPGSLSDDYILAILEDHAGNLWIGTYQGGLNRYDRVQDKFIRYPDIPSSESISSITEDEEGYLWLTTFGSGLIKWHPETGEYRRYGSGDGITNVASSPFTFHSRSGEIFFFWEGMDCFYPGEIKDNEFIPPIVITDFMLYNESCKIGGDSPLEQSLDLTTRIDLSHKQNFLSFEYAALNYMNPEKNQYKYMMVGLDEDWVDAGTRRFVNYSGMQPGKYTFRVIGCNNDRYWNEEGRSIDIIIHPPWYRTGLAYGSYAVLFIMALFGYIRWRTWSLKKEKRVLEAQVKERTKQITQQKEEIESQRDKLEQHAEELTQQKEELQDTLNRLKETQDQLIQSEKLASLGGLVAGVAHEINTPVGISVTAASSLAEETQAMAEKYKANKISRAEFKDYLNTANQSAKLILSNMERTATMVQSFKQVSVDQSTESKRKFKLKEYSEDVIRSLYPKLKGRKIDISLDMDEKLELDSYPGAYSQILTNLVLNSLIHGFGEKEQGNITLTAKRTDGEVLVNYTDSGKGISSEDLSKVFEPFFTTSKKAGTGLGLHIVYNLVTQKLNGRISIDSKPGAGVELKIIIPVS